MTESTAAAANVASGEAHVGVQAQVVHGDVHVYDVPPNAPPEEKYQVGVRYLDGGMPGLARELINEAIANRYETWHVRFHWLLAMLSGRTLREFSAEDSSAFEASRKRIPTGVRDQWADGVQAISRLLNTSVLPGTTSGTEVDVETVLKEFDSLVAEQRGKILRHLGVFLQGTLEDQMWKRDHQHAVDNQTGNDRAGRVWKFFQPAPAGPRVRWPEQVPLSTSERLTVAISAMAFAMAAGYIGWELLRHGSLSGLIAYLVSAACGYAWAVNGLEWWFRANRCRMEDVRRWSPGTRKKARKSNRFASDVDGMFDRYFRKYVPDGMARDVWLAATDGIRWYLRDEIVEVYRESTVKAGQVSWLIRFRVWEVKRSFQDGTFRAYRDQLHVHRATKAFFGVGVAGFTLGALWITVTLRTEPASDAISAAVASLSGWLAVRCWLRIVLRRRHFDADQSESERRMADSEAAFKRWQDKLSDAPSDPEMATWLDYDKKILLGHAMWHYKLTRNQVIAYAFIDAPGGGHKSARVRNGPWRYSKYQLLVFLLTPDGVRQIQADVEFKDGKLRERQRISFGFDAVTAVTFSVDDKYRRTFELGLENGQSISVVVTEPSTDMIQAGEDPEALSETALDATSLANTLRVLEGVAAEGKEWIRERGRGNFFPGSAEDASFSAA